MIYSEIFYTVLAVFIVNAIFNIILTIWLKRKLAAVLLELDELEIAPETVFVNIKPLIRFANKTATKSYVSKSVHNIMDLYKVSTHIHYLLFGIVVLMFFVDYFNLISF